MNFDPTDVHVGNQIKTRRNIANVKLKELADTLGISFEQLQKYESGANRISASMLFRISKALGVCLGAFFEGFQITDDAATSLFEERRLRYLETPEGCRFIRDVDNLPSEIRQGLAGWFLPWQDKVSRIGHLDAAPL